MEGSDSIAGALFFCFWLMHGVAQALAHCVCQSVPDCVRLRQRLFFKLTTSLNTAPALLTCLRLFYERYDHSVYPRPIVCDLGSAVPTRRDLLFWLFKTTETLAKSCAKLVWLNGCGKVFKRSRTQATIAAQKGRQLLNQKLPST